MQTTILDFNFINYDLENKTFTEAWFQISEDNQIKLEDGTWSLTDLEGEFIRAVKKSDIKNIEKFTQDFFLENFENEIDDYIDENNYFNKSEYCEYLYDSYQNR
jgi:hypothetical protein